MSTGRHLGLGSEQPPKLDNKLRLYSMRYCPFSHRVRLALSFKKIAHEIVNINITSKPEWFLQLNPEGKVPALVDTDDTVVSDSIPIINYLEDKYPEPALYSQNTMERDLELMELYDKIVKVFSDCIHKKDTQPLKEAISEICLHLAEFEKELVDRKTQFFGGDKPGILDIIMWPFAERAKALPLIYKEEPEYEKENFINIMKWICAMKKQDFVQKNADPYEMFAKVVEASANEGTIDYDNIQ